MKIVGYTDRFSVEPGDRISLMVSSTEPTFDLRIVRLQHGDLNPNGPGFKAELLQTPIDGSYPGKHQSLPLGSYVQVDIPLEPIDVTAGLTIQAWIWPTLLGEKQQTLVSWRTDKGGFSLDINRDGALSATVADAKGRTQSVAVRGPMRTREWYFVAGIFDPNLSRIRVRQQPVKRWPNDPTAVSATSPMRVRIDSAKPTSILLGALPAERSPGTRQHYNGKIDRPRIIAAALSDAELDHLEQLPSLDGSGLDLIAAWDFARGSETATVVDAGGRGFNGVAINAPTRAMTGFNWRGDETRLADAPDQYGAIHFHEADLEDARWEPSVEFAVPSRWASGMYAFQLTVAHFVDYVPFVVRPHRTRQTRKRRIGLLLPTFTYQAYANEHLYATPERLANFKDGVDGLVSPGTAFEQAAYRYVLQEHLQSIYDFHTDGSGVSSASRLRPMPNIRPGYNLPGLRFEHPHLVDGDLYLVDWLTELGYAFDIFTDGDLNDDGRQLLSSYRVILTGSHPEYWTRSMLEALEGYLDGGGRLMYLGGNGFYWVTSVDPARPHLIEVRRGETGTRPWSSDAGEMYHGTTGELGGLWRSRGRPPHGLVGVGFTAMGGYAPARPYRRTSASHDPKVSWIFDGLGEELIGDFGLHLGGAAGWELDRADVALGTPSHAIVLASSFGHSDAYQHVVEEVGEMDSRQSGTTNSLVRADLTYFAGPNGGAVFSVGSVSWCGSLSTNHYQNNVSQITRNVLDRFSSR